MNFIEKQNNELQIRKVKYKSSKLPIAFTNFSILHLSDLHGKEFGTYNSRLLNIIKNLKPDIIVLTGDMIDRNKGGLKVFKDLITKLNKNFPIFYVVGNHEIQSGKYSLICSWLINNNVHVLDNRMVEFVRDNEKINIYGIMDPYIINVRCGRKNEKERISKFPGLIKSVTKNLNDDDFNVCFVHRPENFNDYKNQKLDLVLAGHAHGGQFRFPLIGGVIAPGQQLFPKYTAGPYYKGNTTMIVSRGLGNSTIPLRINNYPEIVYIQFSKVK